MCVSYFVTRELLCNRLPVIVECGKSYKGRSWFFYLGWAQGFPRKNTCVLYFYNIYLLPSQEQPVQSGQLTVCENQVRTQFTPLCLVLLKLNDNKIEDEHYNHLNEIMEVLD